MVELSVNVINETYGDIEKICGEKTWKGFGFFKWFQEIRQSI